MNTKVAIYIRVSTHFQIDKDSLQVQERELKGYAQFALGTTDCVVFRDAGYSAKNTERPDYQAMLTRIRSGEFSHLLVWKIDRISRNLLDFSAMYKELKQLGVVFVSKNEQFDTSTAMGEAMLKIILVFAELERKMTGERVTSVMLSRANNGQWNGGKTPYGYKRVDGEFYIDDSEALVYGMMLNKYEETHSLCKTAGALNSQGLSSRNGSKWSAVTVRKILTSPWYKGDYIYNVTSLADGFKKHGESEWITVHEHHPRLIDDDRFDAVVARLKLNSRKGKKSGDTYLRKNVNIFAGVLRCAVCGDNYSSTSDRRRANGYRPSMYMCSGKRRGTCKAKYVSDVKLLPEVFNIISAIIRSYGSLSGSKELDCFMRSQSVKLSPDSINRIIEFSRKAGKRVLIEPPQTESASEVEVSTLKERKIKLENAMNRLKSLYLYGNAISEKDYIIENAEIQSKLENVEKRLNELSKSEDFNFEKQASYFLMVSDLSSGEVSLDHLRAMNPEIPKSFIQTVVDHIDIKDGEISNIVFKNGLAVFPEQSTTS